MEAIVYYYFVILFGNIQQCGAIGTCFNSWFVWAGRVGFFLNANKIEKSKELWVLPSSKDFLKTNGIVENGSSVLTRWISGWKI